MNQKITLPTLIRRLLASFLILSLLSINMYAQTYTNGVLISNSTASNGTAAPAGFNWSECGNVTGNTTVANSTLAFGANIATNFTVADDFIVPAGPSWVITKVSVFGVVNAAPPASSPFTDLRIRIHNSNPLLGATTIVFGDLTTNRLTGTSAANVYRISNTLVPPTATSTNFPIWKLDANITGLTLAPGTYWLEYQLGSTLPCFAIPSSPFGVRTVAGYNAIQKNPAGVYALLADNGINQAGATATSPVAVDFPFQIAYATGPCSGTPAPGNTISNVISGCPGSSFGLSLQNATPGTLLTYQWQSGPSATGPWTNILTGGTSSTYSGIVTATNFYQCLVTCSGNTGTSTPVQVALTPATACYCASNATSTADEEVLNVTLGSLNNSSTCTTLAPGAGSILNGYSNYTGYAGAPVATVLKGLTYALSVQIGTCGGNWSNSVAVWIDYNQNGTFEATEKVYVSAATTVGPHTETANITIPATALAGATRMRVVSVETAPGSINACGTYTWGETEDYNVNIVLPTPCAGTPAPGNTLSTQASVCASVTPFTLSLQNNPPVGGLTYQWFSSSAATGTFTPVVGATNPTLTVASISAATFYYCTVTCAGSPGNSSTLGVAINPPTQCYCSSNATTAFDEEILNVTLGTLNNTSTCTTLAPGAGSIQSGYSNYTGYATAPAAPSITAGSTVPISVGVGTCGAFTYTNATAIWIDLNQDGFFTANERVFISPTGTVGAHIESGTITIPGNATVGITRMRVVCVETGTPTSITACGPYFYGETEDYNVNITPCVPLTVTSQPPAAVSATCGTATTIAFVVAGSAPSYQWQYRLNATSPWINVVNAAPYSGATAATLAISPASNTLNGYQYRVVFSGGCSATDFSSVSTLTIAPIVATATPISASFCSNVVGTQQLTITNISSPVPGSVTVNSTFTAPIAIPDAGGASPFPVVNATVLAGINNTINVSTIPAGATITGVSVRMSGTHAYFGDLVMALKAPNNSTINLNYFLAGTGGGASTAFTNTVISSTGTAALSTGTAGGNYTGTFKADLIAAAGTAPFSNTASGPTGYLPNATSWTPLITPTTAANANGNWTLAMFDGGGGDAGALNNWSITINYLLGTPATGVFSGPAGTIFTNAAATVPYTGTAINTVFVNPTAIGVNNYSVVVTDGACSSNPLVIPITANSPVLGTATLTNATICQGTNTSFVLGGTQTGPLTFLHQYQVQTVAGGSWSNISNSGVYSGANTNTLSLTNVPVTFSGYRYRDSISALGACGSLISTVATLTVNPAPVVTISAAPITKLFPGLTTILTAAVSPNAAATYQWYRNAVAVAGATTNKTTVTIDGLGTYTVAVTDVNGCAAIAGNSTPANIVISDSVNLDRLFIYPSPNTGQFQVRFYNDINSSNQTPGVVNVYDEKGSRVFTKAYNVSGAYQAMNVDLGPAHGRGIYRVDLISTSGDRIKTGTVVVF